jgi:hypothetical protein
LAGARDRPLEQERETDGSRERLLGREGDSWDKKETIFDYCPIMLSTYLIGIKDLT